jgi:hypothetical protein
VTVRQRGGGTRSWQVMATHAQVTVTPASGGLSARQAQMLRVSQTRGSAGSALTVSSNGGRATIAFVCIPS